MLSEYIDYNVTPFDGNTMLGACVKSRSIIRKLQNLIPNTEYSLSFYVNNPSSLDYLKTVTIADTYNLSPNTIKSDIAKKLYHSYASLRRAIVAQRRY